MTNVAQMSSRMLPDAPDSARWMARVGVSNMDVRIGREGVPAACDSRIRGLEKP